MTDLIYKIWLPQSLTIGVGYELFWHLNPKKLEPFRASFKQIQDEKFATMNYSSWLNGIYVGKAISASFNKNVDYPNKPLDLTAKNEMSIGQKLELWAISVNAEYDRKHPEEM